MAGWRVPGPLDLYRFRRGLLDTAHATDALLGIAADMVAFPEHRPAGTPSDPLSIDEGTLIRSQAPRPGAAGTASSLAAPTTPLGKMKVVTGSRTATKSEKSFRCPAPGKLGALSAHYESGNRGSAAIGFDTTGGWSYGKYQIETKHGTMNGFLVFATSHSPEMAKKLSDAGGNDAALKGEEKFKAAWTELAKAPAFETLQHDFIAARNYQPLVDKLKGDLKLDVNTRSAALRDVVWSVAVQHGPKSQLIGRALANNNVEKMSDEHIIDAIYNERSATRTDTNRKTTLKYFSKSTEAVQKSVAQRYKHERYCAKDMLAKERATKAPE